MGGINSKGKVYKYDLNGNFIAEYEHIQECCFMNDLSDSHLLNHIRGNFNTCKKNIYTKIYYIKLPNEYLNKKRKVRNSLKIYQYSIKGDFIQEFRCAKDAAKFLNGHYMGICQVANGKIPSSYGYQWSYEKKDKLKPIKIIKKSIIVTDLKNKVLYEFESQTECARKLNLDRGKMLRHMNNKTPYNDMYFKNKDN
jgi:hypothetical protein